MMASYCHLRVSDRNKPHNMSWYMYQLHIIIIILLLLRREEDSPCEQRETGKMYEK